MPLKTSIELPYPDLSGVKKDVKAATVIAPAYASMHGELNTALQYMYHYFIFMGKGDVKTAELIMGIALSEISHLKILGELLFKLGVDPLFTKMPQIGFNCSSKDSVCYSKTPIKMLIDEVTAEIYSVKQYEKISSLLTNENADAVIKRILLDEKLHVEILNERINALGGNFVKKF